MMARPTALDGYHVVMCITNKHQLMGHAAWCNAGAQVPQTHWNVLGFMYSERGLAIMHNRSSRMAFSRSILAYSTAGSSPEVPSVVVEVQTGCSAGFAAQTVSMAARLKRCLWCAQRPPPVCMAADRPTLHDWQAQQHLAWR